jgi:hypothetical protein
VTPAVSIILVIIVVALVFDFINGFHDAANSIATVVSTRACRRRRWDGGLQLHRRHFGTGPNRRLWMVDRRRDLRRPVGLLAITGT